MKRFLLPALICCGLSCVLIALGANPSSFRNSSAAKTSTQSQAQTAAPALRVSPSKENFDIRASLRRSLESHDENRAAAKYRTLSSSNSRFRLQREHAGVQLRWSSLTGAPSRIFSLTDSLSEPGSEDAEALARRFLRDNDDLFNLSADGNELRVARRYVTDHNGVTHLTFQQQLDGLEIFESEMTIHLDRQGAVIAATGELMPAVTQINRTKSPQLSAAEALRHAARDVAVELNGPLSSRMQKNSASAQQTFSRLPGFGREVEARLVYFPLAADQLRLGWQFVMWLKETPDVYLMVIDAERGSLLYRYNLTCYEDAPLRPHGAVFTDESPRPNLPRGNLLAAERRDMDFHAAPFNSAETFIPGDVHYDWWAGFAADNLTSNNASVALDTDADNLPDAPSLKAPDGNFTFPLDLTAEPTSENNQRAAQVNLFYWINRYHDILYSFGFTEAAGNFQIRNFQRGGREGDAIEGDVQDGSGLNNANFTTPPDGGAARVQMHLWSGSPKLDSAFDQTVIIHELTHGLSNRLIGNATGLGAMQSAGMGEGWSDFLALALLAKESDDLNGAYPLAQYVSGNYQRGVRRYPYSTNRSVNPLSFGKISGNTQVHSVGEIWASVLWEARAALIKQHGFQAGQRRSLQLIVDGMKLTPRTPSFIDARDAILLADRVSNNGANQCLLWQAFAKRGLGFSARTNDASDAAPEEAFDAVPWCSETATIRLDRDSYLNGETMEITLSDRNAVEPVSVSVSSSITGDRERVTLARDENTPGRFRGALRIVAAQAVIADNQVQAAVEAGDQIALAYLDSKTADGNLAEISVSASVAREKVIFADTVEKGNQGWITNGAWSIVGNRSVSTAHCWTDSPGRNYYNADSVWLASPTFDLSGMSEVTLGFAHSYQLDQNLDFCLVEYSNDDGVTWSRAAAFSRTQASFVPARIRLRGLDGQARARIRFRLQSDLQSAADGWYIDDIRLTARSADPAIIALHSAQQPIITSLSPAFGPPAGGTALTISGANFTEDADTVVSFDGVRAASVRVISSTTITAITPPHLAGAVTVRVTNRNGDTALAEGFTYFVNGSAATPVLSGLAPSSGSVRGGAVVTIFGSGFTPESAVMFGAQQGAVAFINSQTLRVTTPAATSTGAVEVTVSNQAAQSKLAAAFSYVAATPPQIQVLTPNDGEALHAGSRVSVTWRSADNHELARHRVRFWRNSGGAPQLVYEVASDVAGEAQSFIWAVPADLNLSQARISVIAVDDEGAEAEAFSSGWFAISRRWESSVQLPVIMQEFAVVSDGKYLYTIGGRATSEAETALSTFMRTDPTVARASWRTTGLAQMPFAEGGAGAVVLGGRIFVPGGISASNLMLRRHQVYDIAGNQWDQAANLPTAVINYSLAADENRGAYYLTGGIEAGSLNTAVNKVRAYDANSDQWTELPPLNTARHGHESALIDGRLYVIGGAGAAGLLTSGEVYDFSAQKWAPIAPLNHPRQFASSAIGHDQQGNPLWFVIGGWSGSDSMAGVEVYDVRHNRWLALDESFSLPTPRAWLGGAAHNGYFYAIGGFTISPTNVGGQLLITQRTNERIRIAGVTPISADQAPALAVPDEQIAVAENEISFAVQASDLGSTVPLSITATELPAGALFNASGASNSARGVFRWTPTLADAGRTLRVSFTASDGHLSETKIVTIRVVAAEQATVANAASYRAGVLAKDSIATIFGQRLAVRSQYASALPLPKELAGTSIRVNGVAAQLLFVSATQINFIVPPEIEPGAATLIVSNPTGNYAVSSAQIVMTAPALFTTTATGQGDAAAIATPDGISYQASPFDVTINNRPNHLVLYGTGVRNALADESQNLGEVVRITLDGVPAKVLYAGAQGTYGGLDQINLEIPQSLAGRGERRVELVLSVNGVEANRVTVMIR
jgi:uncharacterized protein (TIGR03437 family)